MRPAEHCSDFCHASLFCRPVCKWADSNTPGGSTLCMPWSEQGKVRSSGLRTAAQIPLSNVSLQALLGIYSFWSCFRQRAVKVEPAISKLQLKAVLYVAVFLLLATSAVEIGPQSFKAAACLRKCCWIKAPCSATLPLLFLCYQLCQPSSKEENLALKWI